ncbi:MAG: hypothetical protein WED04_11670 [Promethearchaeati archaeon SRVP18_Atabeyarchaeia-1]
MSQTDQTPRPRFPEWIFAVVGLFFFFTLASTIFSTLPTLSSDLQTFFLNFTLAIVPNTDMKLPAPSNPGLYTNIYAAGGLFCLGWGFFAILMLVVRVIARSPPWKTAEEFSSMVWWFGAWYLVGVLLTATATLTTWFLFWAAIVMLLGGSLIIRAIILAALR